MNEEFDNLTKMRTWDLVDRPEGRQPIRVKWVYDMKTDSRDEVERYRARLVAMCFFKQEGIDFFEVFGPVVKYTTVRLFFSVTTRKRWKRISIDVKCAFINAFLEEEIYLHQPEGFIIIGDERKVYRLRKVIYGLKKTEKAWHDMLYKIFTELGFKQSYSDPCFYVYSSNKILIILIVYVHDIKKFLETTK